MVADSSSVLDGGTVFWHGGAPGIPVGKRIRPAAGLPMPARYRLGDYYCADPQRVYITVDRKLATAFAAEWRPTENLDNAGHGVLYRVRPLGDLGHDPDFSHHPGLSYTCKVAVVEEVVETEVEENFTIEFHRLSFSYWEPGAPMYDENGYMLPAPIMREHGITASSLRELGRLPDFHALDQLVIRKLGFFPMPDARKP